ncbi:hypothetical protein [Arsenicibacter rosenii]|nr:hypothetical protein [Arsenicibacter rosenii]
MNTKHLKILVIGGSAAQGDNLSAGNSFAEQFARRIEQSGQPVFMEYHTPIDLNKVTNVLYYLNIHRYDLILLQMGHSFLTEPGHFSELLIRKTHQPANTMTLLPEESAFLTHGNSWFNKLKGQVKKGFLHTLNSVNRIGRLRDLVYYLSDALHYLQPYGYKVVLLTPVPDQSPVNDWLRKQGRALFVRMGEAYGIPVFDTQTHIKNGEEYFESADDSRLSGVSQELLGSELYEFYENLMIKQRREAVARSSFRRRLPRDN